MAMQKNKATRAILVSIAFVGSIITSSLAFAGNEIALGYSFLEFKRSSGEQVVVTAGSEDLVEKFSAARFAYAFDFCGSPGFIKLSGADVQHERVGVNLNSEVREFMGGVHFNYGATSDIYFAVGTTTTYGNLADTLGLDSDGGFVEVGIRALAGASRNWEISQNIRYNEKIGSYAETGILYHTAAGWSLGVSYQQSDDFESIDGRSTNAYASQAYTIEGNEAVSFSFRLHM